MSKKHYEWEEGKTPPYIEQHSLVKHQILRSYLVAYIKTLASMPQQEELKLTLVDGFSGGGDYLHKDTREVILGSPFVMLDAVNEADALINLDKLKKLKLNVNYFFIDSELQYTSYLRSRLIDRGHDKYFDDKIFTLHGKFHDLADKIISSIKKSSPKAGRAIFLLDQYGYKDVPAKLINHILSTLPKSEIILTFAADALVNFIGDKKSSNSVLKTVGIPTALRGRSIEDIKNNEKDWRLYIQSKLHQDLVSNCGAKFYTPFFIRSSKGFGDYWLIHLSQHPRARDVMTEIHWSMNNYFIHFGGAGLDMFQMLGYIPEKDNNFMGQTNIETFEFDDIAKEKSHSALSEHIPYAIHGHQHGINFSDLFSSTCNQSPASASLYKKSLITLQDVNELKVLTLKGKARRSSQCIKDTDIIIPSPQFKIFLPSRK